MLWLLLLMTTSLALAWHRAGLRLTTAAYAALLLAYGVFGGSLALFGLGLLLFAALFVPLSLPTLREEWLTRPLLDHFQRRLPSAPLGVIDDGGAAGNRLIFTEGSELLPPASGRDADAQREDGAIQARQPRAVSLRSELRVQACDPQQRVAARQRLLNEAVAAMLLQHASETQRADLLPQLASGRLRIALATQSRWGTGSERATVARGIWKGRETLGLLLDCDVLIDQALLAGDASEYLIAARVRDPEALLGEGAPDRGVALLRVPAALAGLQRRVITPHCLQVGARQLFVGIDRVIGDADGVGRGEAALQTAQIALSAGLLAIDSAIAAQALLATSLDLRLAEFHRLPLASAGGRRTLVEAALDAYGLDVGSQLLTRLIDARRASPQIAALARGDADAIEVRTLAASLLPKVQACFAAAAATPYGVALPLFDAAFWDALGEVLAHQTHAGLQAISDGRINGGINRHRQHLQRYRAALACCGDALLLEREPPNAGSAALSALAEAYAQTLNLFAALQAHSDAGLPRNDELLLDAYCERCGRRIEEALDSYLQSQRRLRRRIGLQVLLLPLGRLARKPDDARYAQLADMIQNAGPVRDRLFAGLAPPSALIARLQAAIDTAAPAQRRLLQGVDAGELQAGFPLEQIVDAVRLKMITAQQADALRAVYNLGEDWRFSSDRSPA
ncbi:acyl-CoA dehydrogenase domain-containing protein [Hydrocarboniphaga sp.]|uniref:acyl-CoA dehydrogenase domain-containing protein n=1 Tax=Hydrocarboniphaga sp. TaxID=2033016 RepID=UPI003D0D5FC9